MTRARPIYCSDIVYRHVKDFATYIETGCGRPAIAFQYHEVWYDEEGAAERYSSCGNPHAHWHAFKRARCGVHIDKSWPAWAAKQPHIRNFRQIPIAGAEVYR